MKFSQKLTGGSMKFSQKVLRAGKLGGKDFVPYKFDFPAPMEAVKEKLSSLEKSRYPH